MHELCFRKFRQLFNEKNFENEPGVEVKKMEREQKLMSIRLISSFFIHGSIDFAGMSYYIPTLLGLGCSYGSNTVIPEAICLLLSVSGPRYYQQKCEPHIFNLQICLAGLLELI